MPILASSVLSFLFAGAAACSLTVDTDDLGSETGDSAGERDASLGDGMASAPDGATDAAASPDGTIANDGSPVVTGDGSTAPDDADAAPGTDYVSLVLAARPLAYYRFEETSSVIAASEVSPGMYNGVYNGDYTQGGSGALGPDGGVSVRFNGSDPANDFGTVMVAGAFGFPSNAPFSYELWFRAVTVDSSYRALFAHGNNNGTGAYQLYWESSSTVPNNLFFASSPPAGSMYLNSELPFSVGVWNYVVIAYDGQTMTMYKNASPANTAFFNVNAGADAGLDTLYIGSGPTEYNEFYGDIDEFAVYDHPLDPATVRAHYAAAVVEASPDGGITDGGHGDAGDGAR